MSGITNRFACELNLTVVMIICYFAEGHENMCVYVIVRYVTMYHHYVVQVI